MIMLISTANKLSNSQILDVNICTDILQAAKDLWKIWKNKIRYHYLELP